MVDDDTLTFLTGGHRIRFTDDVVEIGQSGSRTRFKAGDQALVLAVEGNMVRIQTEGLHIPFVNYEHAVPLDLVERILPLPDSAGR